MTPVYFMATSVILYDIFSIAKMLVIKPTNFLISLYCNHQKTMYDILPKPRQFQ